MPEYGFLIETHFSALAQNRRFCHYTENMVQRKHVFCIFCAVLWYYFHANPPQRKQATLTKLSA